MRSGVFVILLSLSIFACARVDKLAPDAHLSKVEIPGRDEILRGAFSLAPQKLQGSGCTENGDYRIAGDWLAMLVQTATDPALRRDCADQRLEVFCRDYKAEFDFALSVTQPEKVWACYITSLACSEGDIAWSCGFGFLMDKEDRKARQNFICPGTC